MPLGASARRTCRGAPTVAQSLRALALARYCHEQERRLEAFDQTLSALRAAGANRLLGMTLNRAARLTVAAGVQERAKAYAEQALSAADRVERVNEVVEARATLAQIALESGDAARARRHLEALDAHALCPDLSARSAEAMAAPTRFPHQSRLGAKEPTMPYLTVEYDFNPPITDQQLQHMTVVLTPAWMCAK